MRFNSAFKGLMLNLFMKRLY